MSEKEYVDFATVRDLLEQANERRGELSYEQLMALGTLNGRPARIAAAGRPTQRSSGGCVTR